MYNLGISNLCLLMISCIWDVLSARLMQFPVVGRDELVCAIVDHAAGRAVVSRDLAPTLAPCDANDLDMPNRNADLDFAKEMLARQCDNQRDPSYNVKSDDDEPSLVNKMEAAVAQPEALKNGEPGKNRLVDGPNATDDYNTIKESRSGLMTKNDPAAFHPDHGDPPMNTKNDEEENRHSEIRQESVTPAGSKNMRGGRVAASTGQSGQRHYVLMDLNHTTKEGVHASQGHGSEPPASASNLPVFVHGREGSGKSSVLALLCTVLRDSVFMSNALTETQSHDNNAVVFHSTAMVDSALGFGAYSSSSSSRGTTTTTSSSSSSSVFNALSNSWLHPMHSSTDEYVREEATLGLTQNRSRKQLTYLKLRLCLELGDDWVLAAIYNDAINKLERKVDSGDDTEHAIIIQRTTEEYASVVDGVYLEMMRKELFSVASAGTVMIIVIDDFDCVLAALDLDTFVFPRPLPACLRVVASLSTLSVERSNFLERFSVEIVAPEPTVVVSDTSTVKDSPPQPAPPLSRAPSVSRQVSRTVCIPVLSDKFKERLVQNYLGNYNKHLEALQMRSLLRNPGSESLTWLSFACESVRVFGAFETISEFIDSLPSDVNGLLQQFLQRIMIITSMHTVLFTRRAIETCTGDKDEDNDGDEGQEKEEQAAVGTEVEAAVELAVPLDEMMATMLKYILISRFSALEESELRCLCERHHHYCKVNGGSGFGAVLGDRPEASLVECTCSNADWATACFYLRPFCSFKSSKGSREGGNVVTIKTAAINGMLLEYFSIATGYYSEIATDQSELVHRKNLASFCADTREESDHNETRYWSEYAYQLLKADDRVRVGAFRRSADLLRCSRYIRGRVLETCRCDFRLHGVAGNNLLREYMCTNCSLKSVVSVRGHQLKKESWYCEPL
jgi:hypothetical protein